MLRLCNGYSTPIWTAYSFWSPKDCGGEGQNWQNIGWFRIDPGSCAVVYANDLDDVNNRYWYVYADDGTDAEDGIRWDGDFPHFVDYYDAFNVCDGTGRTGLRWLGFREFDVGNADEFTVTFVVRD
jgi:uncharacterized membrane protein